jgi:large conductance mechanosensitive channel
MSSQETSQPPRFSRREVVVSLPRVRLPKLLRPFQGFVNFIREQGVVGLAVGLVLGTQIKGLVDSFIASFINPLLGLLLPGKGDLAQKFFEVTLNDKTQKFMWGAFAAQFISFLIVAAVIYMTVHILKLDKLDRKK